jgi:hypothetical protein
LAFATEASTEDPVDVLMAQRRRAAAFARPSSARTQLHDVAAAVIRGVRSVPAQGDYPLGTRLARVIWPRVTALGRRVRRWAARSTPQRNVASY